MSALTFNGPYDWGYITVGIPQTFEITYSINNSNNVSNIILTLETDSTDTVITNNTVVITPTSDWISPDSIKFQNAELPLYPGDTSNQIEITGVSNITENYSDTLLYCIQLNITQPITKSASVTATATYTLSTPDPDYPTNAPDITQETETQIYTFIEQKNIDSAKATLEQLIDIGISNQNKIFL